MKMQEKLDAFRNGLTMMAPFLSLGLHRNLAPFTISNAPRIQRQALDEASVREDARTNHDSVSGKNLSR